MGINNEIINITKNIKLLKYKYLIDDDNVLKYNEYIYQIKKLVYKKYVEYYWNCWDETVQKKLFINFLNETRESIWLIKYKGRFIGFYDGKSLDKNNYEIGNICINPNFQGQGIGTLILKKIINIHKSQDFHLQYFKINPVGELYKKLGFVINGEKEFHYLMIKKHEN